MKKGKILKEINRELTRLKFKEFSVRSSGQWSDAEKLYTKQRQLNIILTAIEGIE